MALAGNAGQPASMEKEQALRELKRLKRSLRGWLASRKRNDELASGKRKSKLPLNLIRQRIMAARDWAGEQRIADDAYALLSHVYPDAKLPGPSVERDPDAAVKLATIAIKGLPENATGPQAQGVGIIPFIVGGVVLMSVMSGTSAWADVQKAKEDRICVQSGDCTDYGFWIKWSAIGIAGIIVLLNKDKLIAALKFGKK